MTVKKFAQAVDSLVTQAANTAHPTFLQLALSAGLDPATDFREAALRDIDLRDQDLTGFDFTGADLTGADFRRAKIDGVSFAGAQLLGTIGLPSVEPAADEVGVAPLSIWSKVLGWLRCRWRLIGRIGGPTA
jgi:hypothetical protein